MLEMGFQRPCERRDPFMAIAIKYHFKRANRSDFLRQILSHGITGLMNFTVAFVA